MPDQGFFQRNINAGGTALQEASAAGEIAGGVTAVAVDASAADVVMTLPDQVASAGTTIYLLNVTGINNAGVTVQSGDSINGTVDGQSLVGTGALSVGAYTSFGSAGWIRVI